MDELQADLVVGWYLELEERLCAILKTTLFTDDTRDLFLPPLANIVLDAASLLDTVFREHYAATGDRKHLNIADYCLHYEARLKLSERRTVLYQTPPRYVEPFKDWYDPAKKSHIPTSWWRDYNALKHDGIEEYGRATLSNAIHSLCALHQVIAVLEAFKNALLHRDLVCFGNLAKLDAFGAAWSSDPGKVTLLVETELFATPVGERRFPDNIEQIRPHFFASGKKLWRFFGPDH